MSLVCLVCTGGLHSRSDDLRQLMARLRVVESEDQNKITALESAQHQLSHLSEHKSQSELHIHELQVCGITYVAGKCHVSVVQIRACLELRSDKMLNKFFS